MRKIIFYRTESGGCPIEEFLNALTSQQAQKVAWVLQLIEELDVVPVQYFKKLVNTDGIWEVRAPFGGNIFRLLGFLERGNVVILGNYPFNLTMNKNSDRLLLKMKGGH